MRRFFLDHPLIGGVGQGVRALVLVVWRARGPWERARLGRHPPNLFCELAQLTRGRQVGGATRYCVTAGRKP
jgi:hypothetical protein